MLLQVCTLTSDRGHWLFMARPDDKGSCHQLIEAVVKTKCVTPNFVE